MGSPILKSDKIRALLAKNVRGMLATMQWSENELARRSNVSQKQVNNVTMARTGCGIDALDAMAKAFAVETWQLLSPHLMKWGDAPARGSRAYAMFASLTREQQDDVIKLIQSLDAK